MTRGDLQFRLAKAFPGIDQDLIEGWIGDAYQDLLAELSWTRLKVQAILQTTAPYSTGTVTVTRGSNAVTLTGGAWTTVMTGRAFRLSGRSEFYEFTYASATTATLDRVYEGPDATAAGYSIFQHVYPMPANCRILEDDTFSTFSPGPLSRLSRTELNRSNPARTLAGTPLSWASYMDDTSDPPRMQVELSPYPDSAIGIPFAYVAEADTPGDTSTALLPWIQPTALVESVTAKIKRHLKDYAGAREHKMESEMALKQMRANDARRQGPLRIELPDFYTAHRQRRAR